MQKRALSFLLVLCMLLAMVPALVLPLAAAEGDVTIRFIDANTNPSTTTSEQTVSGTGLDFNIPTVPADAFGWYEITPTGAIRKAETYLGETVTGNLTFYLLKKTSAFNGASNWPAYATNTLVGFAGGWTAGSYINHTYTLFNTVDQRNILNNGDTWGKGGIYMNSDSGKRMITTREGMLTLSYNAPMSGLIDVDFDNLSVSFTGDGNAMSDFALAIAVNGVVVWPQAAVGSQVRNDAITVSGTTTYPYWNNGSISHASYSSGHTTNWLYLSVSGNTTPENDPKLATLKALVPGDEEGWKKYSGNETSWQNAEDTALAARDAITDTESEEYKAADAAYQEAKLEHERWTTVKNNCLTVSDYVKVGSMLSQYQSYCTTNNDAPHDIAVTAGDRVDIVVGKVNSPHVTVWPKVTYTKFAGAEPVEEDNVLTYAYGDYDLIQGGKNWPTAAAKDADGNQALIQDFGAAWDFISYTNGTVAGTAYDTRYFSFGGWPNGILWAGDGRIARTADGGAKDEKTNGVGFQYAPNAAGTLDMSFSFTTPAASESAPVYFAVYQYSADGATKTLITPAAAPGATACNAETEGDGIKYTTTASHVVMLSGVTLAKGDKLAFVWRNAASRTTTGYSTAAFAQNFAFRVRYTAGGPTTSTTFDPRGNYNAPVFDFSTGEYGDKLTYTGGWDLVAHNNTSTYDTADVIDTFMYGTGERWFSTGYYGGNIWGHTGASKAFVYVLPSDIGADRGWPNPWGVIPMLGATGGWRYTADGDGTIDLDLTKLRSQNNGTDVAHPGDHGYIAVFKNGKMIWPMAEGTDTNYYGETYQVTVGEGEEATVKTYHSAKWAKIGSYKTNLTAAQIAALPVVDGSAKTGSLTGITVNYGDEIEILVRNDNTATNFWNDEACGFTLVANVTYTEGGSTPKSYFSTSRYDQTIPAAPEAITAGEGGYTAADIAKFNYYYQPIFTDNAWSFVAYPGKNVTAENARTDFYAMNRNPGAANGGRENTEPATGWDDTFWGLPITSAWSDWGNALSPHFRIIGGGVWGDTGSIAAATNAYGGYRYTAPLAGRVDVNITRLLTNAGDDKNDTAEVAIYIDQQKVWPTGDAWFALSEGGVDYTAAARDSINGTLNDVVVGKGSTVEFLVRTKGEATAWTTRGTVFEGAVSYTEWWDVNVTASVNMYTNLSLDVEATTMMVDPDTIQCTMTDDGSVVAKDVAKTIAYRVTGTLDGATVTLAAGTTCISDLLYVYVGSDSEQTSAMAVSILNYTAAAQKYFTPTLTDDQLANAGLTEAQKTVTVTGTEKDYNTAFANTSGSVPPVTMVGMSLILEDSPRFKLLFTGPAPEEGCDYVLGMVQIDNLSGQFSGSPAIYSATATDDGKAYKAITDGIPVTKYNKIYVFAVGGRESTGDDIVEVSYTLYYSVTNYCWAMKDDAQVGAVAKAMLAMYECANML